MTVNHSNPENLGYRFLGRVEESGPDPPLLGRAPAPKNPPPVPVAVVVVRVRRPQSIL